MLASGSLSGDRVGKTWVVDRNALLTLANGNKPESTDGFPRGGLGVWLGWFRGSGLVGFGWFGGVVGLNRTGFAGECFT